MYMKHCKVLIEPIAESKHKKKGPTTDNKVRKKSGTWANGEGEGNCSKN